MIVSLQKINTFDMNSKNPTIPEILYAGLMIDVGEIMDWSEALKIAIMIRKENEINNTRESL